MGPAARNSTFMAQSIPTANDPLPKKSAANVMFPKLKAPKAVKQNRPTIHTACKTMINALAHLLSKHTYIRVSIIEITAKIGRN